jgi:hypothetical protein
VKLGSPALWPAVLTLATSFGASSLVTGCVIEGGSGSSSTPDKTTPAHVLDANPRTVDIEPDKALEAKEGEGVGVFVEYATGGHWHVWTSCDTNTSKAVCNFTAFVTVSEGGKISGLRGENLENGDIAEIDPSSGAVHFDVLTSTEFDGVTFDATPGAIVQLEAYLDSDPDPRIVYWFGAGVLHQGAPTDPINFQPAGQ